MGLFEFSFIPFFWQNILELSILFVYEIIKSQLNNFKIGLKFFFYLYFIFLFILFSNFLGLLPFTLTLTSQFVIDFFFSVSLVFGFTFYGLYLYGISFFDRFIPSNVSKFLVPLIFVIEIISYFIRPISLALRLFANMVAGHTLMHLLTSFLIFILKLEFLKDKFTLIGFFFISVIPFLFFLFIFCLEFGIAFLQSYVFLILSSMYLNDVLSSSH